MIEERELIPMVPVYGSGGGGKGGASGGGGSEADDDLISKPLVTIVDLVSEGEIGGLVDGAKSIYANNTPVQRSTDGKFNFKRVSWEQRTGVQDQQPFAGISDIETPHQANVQVKKSTPFTFSITNPNVDAVRVVVSVPSLYQYTDSGDVVGAEFHVKVFVSTDEGEFVLGKRVDGRDAFLWRSGKNKGQYQSALIVVLPKPASKWDIRVERVTDDSTSAKLQNDTYVAAYVEIVNSRLSYPNSALVKISMDPRTFASIPARSYLVDGIKIRVPSNRTVVNGVATYFGDWNGTFKVETCDNPAWILYDLLTSERYGLGRFMSASQIDRATLYTIGKYCDEQVPDGMDGFERRFACNVTINTRQEAYKLVSDLISVFRGMIYWSGGMAKLTADVPTDPSLTFANANVVDGLFNYMGSSRMDRHSVALVTWNDPKDTYRQKVEYVEDRDLIARIGVREASVVAFGCTSRGQAHRAGLWLLYTEHYETDLITFKASLDGSFAAPGKICRILDQFRAGRRLGGRTSVVTPNSVTLDAPVNIESSGAVLTLVGPDGALIDKQINEGVGEHMTLSWGGDPLSGLEAGGVFTISEPGYLEPLLARIVSVKPDQSGLTYEISAVEHNPSKYGAIEYGLPIIEPPVSVLPDFLADPANMRFDISTYIATANQPAIRLDVAWDGKWESYDVSWRRTDQGGQTNPVNVNVPVNHLEILNAQPGIYEIKVIGRTSFGLISNPLVGTYSLTPSTEKPPAPTGLVAVGDFRQIMLKWSNPESLIVDHIEVFASDTNSSASASRIASVRGSNFTESGLGTNQTRYYWVRSVSVWGVAGDFNSNLGTSATTLIELDYMMNVLDASILDTQLSRYLREKLDRIERLENGFVKLQSMFYDYQSESATALIDIKKDAGDAKAQLTQQAIQRAGENSALSSMVTALLAANKDNYAAVQTEYTARVDGDNAVAAAVTTLTTSVNDNTTSIQELITSTDGLSAQYTVKVDNNGWVSGFGLASYPKNGTPYTDFIVNADRFSIGSPGLYRDLTAGALTRSGSTGYLTLAAHGATVGSWIIVYGETTGAWNRAWKVVGVVDVDTLALAVEPSLPSPATGTISVSMARIPFRVLTTPLDESDPITGERVHFDPGVYIDSAYIGAGTITDAKIGQVIKSQNYWPATTGWIIDKGGVNGDGTTRPPLLELNGINFVLRNGAGDVMLSSTDSSYGLGGMSRLDEINSDNWATYIKYLNADTITVNTLRANRIINGSLASRSTTVSGSVNVAAGSLGDVATMVFSSSLDTNTLAWYMISVFGKFSLYSTYIDVVCFEYIAGHDTSGSYGGYTPLFQKVLYSDSNQTDARFFSATFSELINTKDAMFVAVRANPLNAGNYNNITLDITEMYS